MRAQAHPLGAHSDLFNQFLQHTKAAVFIQRDERFVACNAATLQLLGATAMDQIVGLHPVDISPLQQSDGQDSAARARELLDRATAHGAVRFEWLLRRRDGTLLPIDVFLTPLRNDDGTYLIGMAFDISERYAARTALQRALQREHLISSIAARFVAVKDFHRATAAALADIGIHTRVDRVILLQPDADGVNLHGRYQWCAPDGASVAAPPPGIAMHPSGWINRQLVDHNCVCVHDVAALPAAAVNELQPWLLHGVAALLMMPLRRAGVVIGCIALEAAHSPREWTAAESEFLRVCADVLADALTQYTAEHRLRDSQAELERLVIERTRQLEETNQSLRAEILARAASERAHAEQARILNVMTAQLADMVYYKDRHLRYVFSSRPHCRRVLQCAPGECIGKTDLELAAEARRHGRTALHLETSYNNDVAAQYAGRVCEHFEELTLPGEHVTLEVVRTPLYDEHGAFAGMVGSARDISQRKRDERAIRESEARYRTLFEESPIALWEIDASALKRLLTELQQAGITDLTAYFTRCPEKLVEVVDAVRVVDMNTAATLLSKTRDQQAFATNIIALLQPHATQVHLQLCCALAADEPVFECSAILRAADGQEHVCLCRFVVAKGYATSYAKMFVALVDVTEEFRSQQALRNSEQRLHAIFNNCPVPLVELDCADVFDHLERLRNSAVADPYMYLREHSCELSACLEALRVIDVNDALLTLFGAVDKRQLLTEIGRIGTQQSLQDCAAGLAALAAGRSTYACRTSVMTLAGAQLRVDVALRTAPDPIAADRPARVILSFHAVGDAMPIPPPHAGAGVTDTIPTAPNNHSEDCAMPPRLRTDLAARHQPHNPQQEPP